MRYLKNRLIATLTIAALVAGSLFGTGAIALADTTIPDAPTELAIAPEETTTGPVVLSWTAPANETITRYQIFRYKGTGDPAVSGTTYIADVDGDTTTFADEIPTEGTFYYAVVAVDDDSQASEPTDWVSVLVDIDSDGVIEADDLAPAAPTNLDLGGAFSQSRTVTLTWAEQSEPDLWRFLIYRADNDGEPSLIGYKPGEDNQFTETLEADGEYTYYLIAQDETGNVSAYSAGKRVVVDTVAPGVSISSPENGRTYTGTGRLSVIAAVYDEGSGYTPGAIDIYLDGTELNSSFIELGNLANGQHTLRVTVTDRAGNVGEDQVLFFVGNAQSDPAAPQDVTVPLYSKTRSVPVRWSAPDTSGVSGYLVYRSRNSQQAVLVASTPANLRSFTDLVPADDRYTYQVVARYASGAEVASLAATTTVDTAAPVISINAPDQTNYTTADSFILIDVDVTDATSGVADSAIKHYLDGQRYTEPTIDLTLLEDGRHTFKVEATDRAGNRATRTVTFTLNGSGADDDNGGRPVSRAELVALLDDLHGEGKIRKGNHAALSAFARNGNMKAFRHHLMRFGNSRFISQEATLALLEALGDDNSVPGKGRGRNR